MDVLVAFTVFAFIYTFFMITFTSVSAAMASEVSYATTAPVWAFQHNEWRRDQVTKV